jgi:hypothetical protein
MCNIFSVVLVCRLDLCFHALLLAILGQGEGGMTNHEVFEETNFVLQKGAMLPVARLAYKTVGALKPTPTVSARSAPDRPRRRESY